jgi:photosystem II stability/assembly factor-like uncharacterized protein
MSVMGRERVQGRSLTLGVALAASLAVLTACSSSEPNTSTSSTTAQGPSAQTTPVVDAPDWGHIHNLSLKGETLFIGSHDGMWKQEQQQEPVLVSAPAFDVMGLTQNGDRWLASGHPGPEMNSPGNLGLMASDDGGVTWQSVSLSGEVDFHRLVAADNVVVGLSAHDRTLLRSEDGGQTWLNLGSPPLYDLAVDPKNATVVVATTSDGLVHSADAGRTFTPIASPALLAFLAWTDSGLYSASTDGQVFVSTDEGTTWKARGEMEGQPESFAADASTVISLVGDSIVESLDGGLSFSPRVTGIARH